MSNEQQFTGTVEKRRLYAGTKSEHEGLVLVVGTTSYKIRRQGGNPFHDPELEKLVGSTVTCKGHLQDKVISITGMVDGPVGA